MTCSIFWKIFLGKPKQISSPTGCRTFKFCGWGTKEAGLIGSNEWVEEHERALSTKGVSYINIDVSVAGTHVLHLSGSPLLKTSITEIVKNVQDPHLESHGMHKTLYKRMVKIFPGENGGITFQTLGSGSDYASYYYRWWEFQFIAFLPPRNGFCK